jgi:hypothetical protein
MTLTLTVLEATELHVAVTERIAALTVWHTAVHEIEARIALADLLAADNRILAKLEGR